MNKKKMNDKGHHFYCLQCKKRFRKLQDFKYHFKGEESPRGCKYVCNAMIGKQSPDEWAEAMGLTTQPIAWKACKDNALEQIKYYKIPIAVKRKKNKQKYMYTKTPDYCDIIRATHKNTNQLFKIFSKDIQDINTFVEKRIITTYLDKQFNLGYHTLAVRKSNLITGNDDDGAFKYNLDKERYYLVKDNIIYAPFRTKNKTLIRVGHVSNIHFDYKDFKIDKHISRDEWIKRYGTIETQDNLEKAYVLNFGKLSSELIHKGTIETGFEVKATEDWTHPHQLTRKFLDLKQYNINECIVNLDNKKQTYGYTQKYYSYSYATSTQKFRKFQDIDHRFAGLTRDFKQATDIKIIPHKFNYKECLKRHWEKTRN